jgi:hypothetical protein
VQRFASHRAGRPGAPGRLVNHSQGTGAAAALLEMRKEGWERERAKAVENPTMRRPIEATAERFGKLAEKFEAAR